MSTLPGKKYGMENDFPIFDHLETGRHEEIVICSDPDSGLRSIIAIHNTVLGPALGGVRMWPYPNESEALIDVLRLSRGMTYKAAISGLNFGGGKAVIIGDPHKDKNKALFRAFGRYVESLGGRYLTAEDVGINEQDMEWVYGVTDYVTGLPKALGGGGAPSPLTAFGVYVGMKACAVKAYGNDSLAGKRIAIQGSGEVGSHLAEYLVKEGAKLYVTDIFEEKAIDLAGKVDAEFVEPDEIYSLDVDIFSPCALGGVINDESVELLNTDIVAGGANNVLEDEERHGEMLYEKGLIYAPDYAINAGGIINISSELEGYDSEKAHKKASKIYDTILEILHYSETHGIPTNIASNKLAEERLKKAADSRKED
jgi:leucine dehydrogenase